MGFQAPAFRLAQLAEWIVKVIVGYELANEMRGILSLSLSLPSKQIKKKPE